jgi:glycosyltransferase involved in cell wall biosynthesis
MYVGEANKKYFLAHGLRDNQLCFMPHAIENNRFAINEDLISRAKEWRNKLAIPTNALVFLFVGKLENKKQPALLLNAFKLLNDNNHLIFVGSGILENKLKEDAKELPNIHFLGFKNQSEMPLMYALADVFVLPSSGPGETWGLAINEAMAAGKAIVASDACGAVYDLINGNGFIFETNNENDLLEKLKRFNTKNLNDFKQKSLEMILNYSFEEQCNAVETVMENFVHES